MLNSIEATMVIGAAIGILIGLFAKDKRSGCALLTAVPVLMVAYVFYWQWQHEDQLRSTSGLEFIFGPLWPSLGAFAGYYFITACRPVRPNQ
jgi:uncharacterized membrane protein YfcA